MSACDALIRKYDLVNMTHAESLVPRQVKCVGFCDNVTAATATADQWYECSHYIDEVLPPLVAGALIVGIILTLCAWAYIIWFVCKTRREGFEDEKDEFDTHPLFWTGSCLCPIFGWHAIFRILRRHQQHARSGLFNALIYFVAFDVPIVVLLMPTIAFYFYMIFVREGSE